MMKEYFNGVVSFTGTILTYLLGGWDMAIGILVLFMALDYITGVIKSMAFKETSSKTGFIGIARKVVIFVVLIIATQLDKLVGGTPVFRTMVCYFYIANEGISILENCATMGLPLPKKLKDILVQLKDKNDTGIE